MTHRYRWDELPHRVRDVVQTHAGMISSAVPADEGQSSHVALTLHRDQRPPVFLKGVKGVSREMRWLRNEIEVGGIAPGVAPAVLFHADVDDWLVVGFGHVDGRPADLRPGSADLPAVASALDRIGAVTATGLPALRDRWRGRWWHKLAEERPDVASGWDLNQVARWEQRTLELLDGGHLLHTDLHADQFVLSDNGDTHVIDWGWPASGPCWVDPAFMVIRLIEAGHPIADAQSWARAHTRWASASEEAITAFAVYVAGLWSYKAATEALARIARDYAAWRLQ